MMGTHKASQRLLKITQKTAHPRLQFVILDPDTFALLQKCGLDLLSLKTLRKEMMRKLTLISAIAMLLTGINSVHAETNPTSAELDAFWAEVSRTVAEGDFVGYVATYHPDAILVSESRETSYPIASALKGWQQGFQDTKAGKMQASVEFRFTQRLNDQTTAHETGIFHYSAKPEQGDMADQYIHFEPLLAKKDGWKMMMEYQKSSATPEQWATAN